jgi:hypothetical protein
MRSRDHLRSFRFYIEHSNIQTCKHSKFRVKVRVMIGRADFFSGITAYQVGTLCGCLVCVRVCVHRFLRFTALRALLHVSNGMIPTHAVVVVRRGSFFSSVRSLGIIGMTQERVGKLPRTSLGCSVSRKHATLCQLPAACESQGKRHAEHYRNVRSLLLPTYFEVLCVFYSSVSADEDGDYFSMYRN